MHNAFRKMAKGLNIGLDKIMPDAFVLALALAVVAYVAGLIMTDSSPLDLAVYFGEGFWGFLSFSMQMTMIVTTGYMLATTPAMKKGLKRLCMIPKGPVSGAIFTAIVACLLGFFNWGLGLVAGAFVARNVAMNLRKVDFKMLVSVAYIGGSAAGTCGISGSEFLLINTPGWFMEDSVGLIPVGDTIFSVHGILSAVICFLIVVPLMVWLMHPKEEDLSPLDPSIRNVFDEQDRLDQEALENVKPKKEMTFAERCDNGRILVYLVVVAVTAYLVYYFYNNGFNLTIDITNILILDIAMLLHGTPTNILRAAQEGVRSAFGVALQFPFYGGIQGILSSSGMVAIIAEFFASISSVVTFPFVTYFLGAILNIFIPSSGGIFMVSGPVLAEAAATLGVNHAQWIFAFTWGEGISNIIQPFWAIPLLGLCNMKMRDIMGYCIMFFITITIVAMVIWGFAW